MKTSFPVRTDNAGSSQGLMLGWMGLALVLVGFFTALSTARAATGSVVSSGSLHTCTVTKDGTVRCWGGGDQGQLGNGKLAPNVQFRTLPAMVRGEGGNGLLTNVVSVAAGYSHSCALTKQGTVLCWGNNASGQLGNNSTTVSFTPVKVKNAGSNAPLSDVVAIAAGGESTCAVVKDGTARCWGRGNTGQLGDGNFNNSPYPVPVSGLSGVVAIDVGSAHACAALADGSVKCWGRGSEGQLGGGAWAQSQPLPAAVKDQSNVMLLTTMVAVSTGDFHTCAVKADMTVLCWGRTYSGVAGGALVDRNLPIAIKGVTMVVALSTSFGRSFALAADGTAKWWGYAGTNEPRSGASLVSQPTPVVLKIDARRALSDIGAISVGLSSACASKTDGMAVCWGNNHYGQLGDGTSAVRAQPVTVRNESNTGALTKLGSPLLIDAEMNSDVASQWEKANHFNGGMFNTVWKPTNVTFKDSLMNLTLKPCSSGCYPTGAPRTYESGEYRSIAKPGYGKYVTRMKAAKGSGVVSSMFTYAPNLNASGLPMYDKQDEIDIELLGRTDKYAAADGNPGGSCNGRMMLQINYFNNGVGNNEVRIPLSFDASVGYHTYAFDWQPAYIRWYVDGQVVWTYWRDGAGAVKGWGLAGYNGACVPITSKNGTTAIPDLPGQAMLNFWTGVNTADITAWLGKTNVSSPLVTSYDSVKVAQMPAP